MKIRTATPATRSDCVLDSRLSPDQANRFAQRLDHGLPLAEAADYLLEEHGLQLSRASISRWIAKRRRAKSAATFARVAETAQQAADAPAPDVDRLIESNAFMLNQLIQTAAQNGDPYAMMHASKVFANLVGTVAKGRRADTGARALDLAVRKFEFNAATAMLEHADELQKISKDSRQTRQEKLNRVIVRMFGRPPIPADGVMTEGEKALQVAADQLEAEEAAEKARNPEIVAPEPASCSGGLRPSVDPSDGGAPTAAEEVTDGHRPPLQPEAPAEPARPLPPPPRTFHEEMRHRMANPPPRKPFDFSDPGENFFDQNLRRPAWAE